jgi:hypothetical protein
MHSAKSVKTAAATNMNLMDMASLLPPFGIAGIEDATVTMESKDQWALPKRLKHDGDAAVRPIWARSPDRA